MGGGSAPPMPAPQPAPVIETKEETEQRAAEEARKKAQEEEKRKPKTLMTAGGARGDESAAELGRTQAQVKLKSLLGGS